MSLNELRFCAGLAFALLMGNQSAMAAAPEVNIAQGPLFSGRGNVHPNMLLNLSVEFPTVGAAYRGTNDYNKATEYLGYFNPKKCYTYPVITVSNTPTTATTSSSSSTSTTSSSTVGTSTTSGSSSAIVTTSSNVTGTATVSTSAPVTTTTGTTTTGLMSICGNQYCDRHADHNHDHNG